MDIKQRNEEMRRGVSFTLLFIITNIIFKPVPGSEYGLIPYLFEIRTIEIDWEKVKKHFNK